LFIVATFVRTIASLTHY